jgi:hypothetical protein
LLGQWHLIGKLLETIVQTACGAVVSEATTATIGRLKTIRFSDELPANEHLRRAIASSHVEALRFVISDFEASAKSDTPRYATLIPALRATVGQSFNIFLDPTKVEANFSEKESFRVFDVLMGVQFLDEQQSPQSDRLRDGAWNALIKAAKLTKDAPLYDFQQAFNDPVRGYLPSLAHCFRDKLKSPQSQVFQMATILALARLSEPRPTESEAGRSAAEVGTAGEIEDLMRQLIEEKWPAIDNRLAQLQGAVDRLRNALVLDGSAIIWWPRLPESILPKSEVDGFKFDYALDPLHGRDRELFELEQDFLLPPQPAERLDPLSAFRWDVLCGPAGSGKSRFAMELVQRVRDYWPLSGFLTRQRLADVDRWAQQIEQPAFFVIDYAGAKPHVAEFLQVLARRSMSGHLTHPVRVLLVERSASDPTILQLLEAEPAVKLTGPESAERFRSLEPLTNTDIVALMRRRLAPADSSAHTDEQLLAKLTKFDEKRRPLFATIVAHAIDRKILPEIEGDGSAETARWKLFGDLLKYWRANSWLRHVRGSQAPDHAHQTKLANDCRLAALSTLMQGIATFEYEAMRSSRLWPDLARALPELDEPTQREVEHIVGGSFADTDSMMMFGPLEPDLIGERFAMEIIGSDIMHRDKLLEVAWDVAPWQTAGFASRCFQNYPEATRRLGFLLPPRLTPHAAAAKSALVNNLIAEYAERHMDETPSLAEQEFVIELYDLFGADLLEAALTEPELARQVAAATSQAVTLLARAVNRKIKITVQPPGPLVEIESQDRRALFNARAKGSDPDVIH